MIKLFELSVRRAGVEREAYLNGLVQAVAELARVPGVRGFTVQEALPLPARADIVQLDVPSAIDAFIEIWLDDRVASEVALARSEADGWREVRSALVGSAKTLVLIEHPLIPVPSARPPTRNNAFLTRHPRLDHAGFLHEWIDAHGEMCHGVPNLRAFVPCEVVAMPPQRDVDELRTGEIHGVAQAWFDSPEAELAMIQTPEAKRWFAHGAQTFGLIKAFGAREHAARPPANEI